MTTPLQELVEPPDYATPIAAAERDTFRWLDVAGPGWIAILSRVVTAPPDGAAQGARYIVPDGATGVWAGHARHVAFLTPDGWRFRAPREAWVAAVLDEGDPFLLYVYDGTEWVRLPANVLQLGGSALDASDVGFQGYGLPGDPLDVDAALEELFGIAADHETRIDDLEAASGGGGGGGGGVGYPGTLDDLYFWFQGDTLALSAGKIVPVIQNRSATFLAMSANRTGNGATRAAAQLNLKNAMTFPGSAQGRYQTPVGFPLTKATVFVVFKPSSVAQDGVFVSGGTGSFQVQVEQTTAKVRLIKSNVALIAAATTGNSVGAWFQANATYDDTTGAFAFRQGQAANGSGTNLQAITDYSNSIGYDAAAVVNDLNGDLAELIVFNRVLSPTEIANVEAYLFTKWGV